MSRDLLLELRRAHAFDHHPPFSHLRLLHVAFENLVPGANVEGRVSEAIKHEGRVALIGPSGCGKSSVVAFVLNTGPEAIAPILVPVSASPPSELMEPSNVADYILQELARHAGQMGLVGDQEKEQALLRAAPEQSITSADSLRAGGGFSAFGLRGQLAQDIGRQLEAVRRVGPEEKLEVVYQITERMRSAGLTPVLVFDDTDRWLRRPGQPDMQEVIDAFFNRVIRWVLDLHCAFIAAVHDEYFITLPRERLLQYFDAPVDLPPIRDVSGVSTVLGRRIQVATQASSFSDATAEDAFEPEAIDALYESYTEKIGDLRRIIRIAHMALVEACDTGSEHITEPLISSAVGAE